MPSIPIEVSARHVHISEPDLMSLFGLSELTADHNISQPQQFAATQRVTIRGPKGEFKQVAIVGPCRPKTQVELSMTDARYLGLDVPMSDSAALDQAAKITIIGPQGELVRAAAIVPRRHLHLNPDQAAALGLQDRQIVSVQITGPRAARLDQVMVRVHPDYDSALHLDTDEGNACGVKPGMTAAVIH